MNSKTLSLTILFFVSFSFSIFGQQTRELKKTTIYFKSNSSQFVDTELTQFVKFTQEIKNLEIAQITIKAHTDTKGDSLKNIELSDKRAQDVKKKLIQNFNFPDSLFKVYSYGPNRPKLNNDTEKADSLNRRVEVLLFCFYKQSQDAIKENVIVENNLIVPENVELVEEECKGKDTIVALSGDMFYTFNTCDAEYFTQTIYIEDKMTEEGIGDSILLQDNLGYDLESNGMAFFTIKQEDIQCDKPIKILMPLEDTTQGFEYFMFDRNTRRWEQNTIRKNISVETINGQRFLQLTLECRNLQKYLRNGVYSFGINKDKRTSRIRRRGGSACLSRIKIKKNYTILYVSSEDVINKRLRKISNKRTRANYKPNRLWMNVNILYHPNYKSKIVVKDNKSGEVLYLNIEDLKKRGFSSRYRLGFLPVIKKCNYYRTYTTNKGVW